MPFKFNAGLTIKNFNFRPKKQGDTLFALPENLKIESSNRKTEDMLSNQMLSGIPEVDLGIEWVKSKKRKSPIDQSNMLYGFSEFDFGI